MAGMGFYGALAGAGGAAQDYLKMRDQADLSYQKEALLNQLRAQQQYMIEAQKVDNKQTRFDWKLDKDGRAISGTKQNYNAFAQPIGGLVTATDSDIAEYNQRVDDLQSKIDARNDNAETKRIAQQSLDAYRNGQLALGSQNLALRKEIASSHGSGGGGSSGSGGNSSANGFSGFTVPKGVSGDNALSAMAHSMITGNPEVSRQATSAGIPITYLQQASERAVANMKAQYDAGQKPDLPGVVYQRVVNNLLNSPAIRKVRVPTARSLDSQDNGTYGQ